MSYTILAINPGHNGSAALVMDGRLEFYVEEERLSRMKYDGNPFRSMLIALTNYNIDELVIGGTTTDLSRLPWTLEDAYSALARKFNPNIKITIMGHFHHLSHAAGAFYNSGFDTATAIIVDGAGSYHGENINEQVGTGGFETESIYHCSYPHEFEAVYKKYSNNSAIYYDNGIQEFDNSVTITKAYEAVTEYLGFGFIEAGKTMGLAPYGQEDDDIPDFFINGKGNKNLLIPSYPAGAFIDTDRYPYLKKFANQSLWHNDPILVRDVDKNLAYKIQKQAEEQVSNLIQKAIDITGEQNIVISGGFGLNCVANYKFIKQFPDIKFYIDPIAHDGGTAIGLAKYAWYQYSKEIEPRKLTSVFLGPMPDYQSLDTVQNILEAQNSKLTIIDATSSDVAHLLNEGKIIAIYQGRAEGGPRALGNRSILFDPRREDGKEYVNSVKHREWFRPFAGAVLKEYASDWFDMATLDESPFMMYAVDVLPEKTNIIPAITHVDNTCRVQTVSEEDNIHFYNLINEFYQITSVPILFNTSFNLAGHPLVETITDAVSTLLSSDINYLYLPELGKLISK